MTMSNDYTDTLRRIKDTEEASAREVADRRKALEEELRHLEEESMGSIAAAKQQAELYVSRQVEDARTSSQVQAEKALQDAAKESEKIASKKLDKKDLKKVVDELLFAEFRGKE
jgi:vacuolar-type H+-ATPase subunit H